MKLTSDSLVDGARIGDEYAFAVIDERTHVALSANRNPHLRWSDAPAGTRSFAVLCVDADVPSRGDDVNQAGREVAASLPRVDFFHWALFDIPPSVHEIAAGSHSDGITPRGKRGPTAPQGWRHARNDYTAWFASDPEMSGAYYGYDGPCPPWNDARIHHYTFALYALAVDALIVADDAGGKEVRAALQDHVLAQASLTVTYTLNPRLL